MIVSSFVHLLSLLLSHHFSAVPQSQQNHWNHDVGIVLDLSSGVGGFEGVLVGYFGERSVHHTESINFVRLAGIVSDVLAEKIVVCN